MLINLLPIPLMNNPKLINKLMIQIPIKPLHISIPITVKLLLGDHPSPHPPNLAQSKPDTL